MSRQVLVVGAGVVGLSTAWYMAVEGADVTVLDAGKVGRGASWGNAGWIVPSLASPIPSKVTLSYIARSVGSPHSPLHLRPQLDPGWLPWMWRFARSCNRSAHVAGYHATARLAARAMPLFDELAAAGVSFDMWQSGLLFVGLSEKALVQQLEDLRVLENYGYRLPSKPMCTAATLELEPALSKRIAGGFLVAEERHVDPGSLTAGLSACLRARGSTIVEDAVVTGFDTRNGSVRAARTSRGDFKAEQVVLAAGAWSARLGRLLGSRLPVRAGKGYSFSTVPSVMPDRPLYMVEAKVGTSPLGSKMRVAGTMELTGPNSTVDARRLEAMRYSASRYLSDLPPLTHTAEPWAGPRPLTPDGLPMIGRLPGFNNAFVATGHAMLGVTLGPATGEALAALILKGEEPGVLRPFRAERFSTRKSGVTARAGAAR